MFILPTFFIHFSFHFFVGLANEIEDQQQKNYFFDAGRVSILTRVFNRIQCFDIPIISCLFREKIYHLDSGSQSKCVSWLKQAESGFLGINLVNFYFLQFSASNPNCFQTDIIIKIMQQEKPQDFTKCMQLLHATFTGTSQEVREAEKELLQNYKSYQKELGKIITADDPSQEKMNFKQAAACIVRKIAFTLYINENSDKTEANSFKEYLKNLIWQKNTPTKVFKFLAQGFIILSLCINGATYYDKLSKDVGTRYTMGQTLKASYLLEQTLRDKHYLNRSQQKMSNIDKRAPLLGVSEKKTVIKNVFPSSLQSIHKKMRSVIEQIQTTPLEEINVEDPNLDQFCQSWEIVGTILSELDFDQYYPVDSSQAQPIFSVFLLEIMSNTLLTNTKMNYLIQKRNGNGDYYNDNQYQISRKIPVKNDTNLASRRFIVHFFKNVAKSSKSYLQSNNQIISNLCKIGYEYLTSKYDEVIYNPPLVSTVLREYPPTDFQAEVMHTLIENTQFIEEKKYTSLPELLHSYFFSAYNDLINIEIVEIQRPIPAQEMWTDKNRSLDQETLQVFQRFEEIINDLIFGNYIDEYNKPIEKSQELTHTHFYKLGYLLNMLVKKNEQSNKVFLKMAQRLLPLSKNPSDVVEFQPCFLTILSMVCNEKEYTIKVGLFFAIHLAGMLQQDGKLLNWIQEIIQEWFPIYLDQFQKNNGLPSVEDQKEFFMFLILYTKYADDLSGSLENFAAPSQLLTILFTNTNSMAIDLAILEALTAYVKMGYDYQSQHKDNIDNIIRTLGGMLNDINSLGNNSFNEMIKKISQVYMMTVKNYLGQLLLNSETMEEVTLPNIFDTLSKNLDFINLSTYVMLLSQVTYAKKTEENLYLVGEKSLQCIISCFNNAIQDQTTLQQLFVLLNDCIISIKTLGTTKGENNQNAENILNVDNKYVLMIETKIMENIQALMQKENFHQKPERELLFRFYLLILKLRDTDEQQFEDLAVRMFDACLKYISQESFNMFDSCFGQVKMETLENLVRFFIMLHWGTVNFAYLIKKEQIECFMDTFDMYQDFKKTYQYQIKQDNYKFFLFSKYKTQVMLMLLNIPSIIPILQQREWKGSKKFQPSAPSLSYLSPLSLEIFSSANQYQIDYEMPMLLGEINLKLEPLLTNSEELDQESLKFIHLYLKLSMNLLQKMMVRSTFKQTDNNHQQIKQFNGQNDVSDYEDQQEDAKIKKNYVEFHKKVMSIYKAMYDPNLEQRYKNAEISNRTIIKRLEKEKEAWFHEVMHKFVPNQTTSTVQPLLNKLKRAKKQ